MSKLLLHVGEGFSLLDEKRGEGMVQVVHPDIAEFCLCQELPPHAMTNVCMSQWGSCYGEKDPRGHLAPALPQGLFLPLQHQRLKGFGQLPGHIDSPAFAVLRGRRPAKRDRPFHLDEPPVKVDVVPLEPDRLAKL